MALWHEFTEVATAWTPRVGMPLDFARSVEREAVAKKVKESFLYPLRYVVDATHAATVAEYEAKLAALGADTARRAFMEREAARIPVLRALNELPTRTTPDGTWTVCPSCQGDGHFVPFDGYCPAEWRHRFLIDAARIPPPETP